MKKDYERRRYVSLGYYILLLLIIHTVAGNNIILQVSVSCFGTELQQND